MTRTAQNLELNDFSAGLNTESSPLTSLPNSSRDEQNLVLNKDGSRSRRNGLQREAVSPLLTPISSPGTTANNMFLNHLKIGPSEGFIISSGTQTSRLLSRTPSGSWTGNVLATGYGKLSGTNSSTGEVNNSLAFTASSVFVGGGNDTFNGYNIETGIVYGGEERKVKVRDLWGNLNQEFEDKQNRRWLPNNFEYISDGQGSYTWTPFTREEANYVYNLYNQTWSTRWYVREEPDEGLVSEFGEVTNVKLRAGTSPLFRQRSGDKENPYDYYPALTDNFWLYTAGVGAAERGTSSYIIENYLGYNYYKDLAAVRGRFLISPLDRSNTRRVAVQEYVDDIWKDVEIGEIPGAPNPDYDFSQAGVSEWRDISTGQFNCVSGHLGRVWASTRTTEAYSIASTPDLDSLVFFSQTAKTPQDVTKMHGEISPTSEDFEEALDTGGGFVTISGMSVCTALVPLDRAMMVFSPEGVWQIDGGENNFSANNVQVTKLSDIGTNYARSIVSTGKAIYYWGEGGIYSIVQNDVSLKGVANNVSYAKVNQLVEEVEYPERISGIYDIVSQECRWLFCEKGKTIRYRQCSSELVLDTVTEAFSLNRFPVGSQYPQLIGYVPVERYRTTDSDRGTSVALVAVQGDGNRTGDSGMSYEFYTYTNGGFRDYAHIDGGVDAKAYTLGGYITASDSQRKKQMGYVTCSFKRTEDGFTGSEEAGWEATNPSSCFMQTQWGWTSSATTGKWGRKQQVYRFQRLYVPEDPSTDDWSNFGYDVINSRTKVRGMGKAVSVLFESEEGKNMHLYGWGSNASVADNV